MATEAHLTERRLEENSSSISWGAIIAGALIGLSTQLLFTLLGSAIGFTAFDPEQGDTVGRGATIGAAIYLLITMLISFFIGGYVASRLAGFKFRASAVLHGLSSWALITAFLTFMIGSGVSSILGGAFSLTRGGAQAFMSSQQGAGTAQSDPVESLSKQLGISRAEAENIAKQFEQNKGQLGGKAADVTARGSWLAFFSLLFGAIAASLGGLAGSAVKTVSQNRVDRSRRAA